MSDGSRLNYAPVKLWRSALIKTLRTISFAVASLLAFSVPVFAHHGGAAYETDKSVIVKGTVTEYIWSNPHVFVKVDVKDDKGNIVHWIVESQNPVSMMAIGLSVLSSPTRSPPFRSMRRSRSLMVESATAKYR